MKVGLDLDNCVVGIMASAREAMARDLSIPVSDIIETQIYWEPFTHNDPQIAQKLKPDLAFWDREDVLLGAPALPDAIEAAHRLHDAGLLACYITRRPNAVAHLTQQWLDHRSAPPVPTFHVGSTDKDDYFAQCKSHACKKLGVTHMVDDQPHEACSLSEAGINVILIDAPIGRANRHEFIAANPHIPVAANLPLAVDLLFDEHKRAA
ncbi:hypothetical protein [Erythrobacter aureus]|uniref:HAD family hydrolase n=1 Tax=Erythrobacter aureus TaxID=2182384 RepID=A0A345YIG5_9SPHN|nr:hypothetical protein [Erythrobacter aureus]AXK43717.1 hypothetical protein DVR09_14765 [Erythrobacter aureus]